MEMTVNGRDTEQYQYHHHHLGLGLGLGLSRGMASTTSPVETAAHAGAGLFFPASSGEQRTHAESDDRWLAATGDAVPARIDVNRAPATGDARTEPGASSPDSTLSNSNLSGVPTRIGGEEQHRAGTGSHDEDDSGAGAGGGVSRKKLRLSREQSAVLEESFKEHSTLNPKQQKVVLARQLGLRPRQVEVWFQNRRARMKLKQTAVGCEALKRCCETLTEENRRLQRELCALKLLALPAPHLYIPTTLTMCPSCEHVAPSVKPAAAAMDENLVSPVLPVFVMMDKLID